MSLAPTPIAILASGRGSNAKSIVGAIRAGHLLAEITAIVCDQPQAPVLDWARELGLKTIVVPHQAGESRESHEARWTAQLHQRPEWLVLAGYRRLLSSSLLSVWRDRVVNVHPSLLPAFPGFHSYRQALEYGCRVTGVTVHLVSEEMDAGPICAQRPLAIEPADSVEALEARGLALEHELYPQTLSWLLAGSYSIEKTPSGRSRVRPH